MDLNRTLEQLENDYWGEPSYDSQLVKTCHILRKKPLKYFKTEDFRILIGQNISLNYLIPLALEVLKKDLLAEGDYYSGDLLLSVLKSDIKFWINNLDKWTTLRDLIARNIDIIKTCDNSEEIKNNILESFENLKKIF